MDLVCPGIAPTSACGTGASQRSAASASGPARSSTPTARWWRPASSTATPTWTPRSSGTRWAPRPAGTASPAWSWATAASPWPRARTPTSSMVVRNLQRAEDISPEAMEAGIKWQWTTYPRVPRHHRVAAQGHQLLRLHRPLRPAHLRHGRARLRPEGHRGRPQGHGARGARRPARRRHRLHHLALAGPRDPRRPAGGEPRGHLGRGAAAGRRHGRDERGHLRAGRRGRGPRRRRSGPARVSPPAARPGRGGRAAHHLRRLQPAHRPRRLAPVPGPARRDRGPGRAHVRPGAQPLAEHLALVQDPAALRPPARVEGVPRPSAGRAAAEARAIPTCAAG